MEIDLSIYKETKRFGEHLYACPPEGEKIEKDPFSFQISQSSAHGSDAHWHRPESNAAPA
jgi:hypothetical protein